MYQRVLALLSSIWLGLHLGLGYIAAPLLFAHLDKVQAGTIAGELFHIVHLSGIVIWCMVWKQYHRQTAYLDFHTPKIKKWLQLLILLLIINEALVSPIIQALKTNETHWLHTLLGGDFAMWHGVSSIIYLIIGILAIILLWRFLRLKLH